MKIKTLPRAHCDETFVSWIYRCAINKKCINITMGDVDEYVMQWRRSREYIDVDFDFESEPFFNLCRNIGLDLRCVAPFFSLPEFTLPLSYWFRYAYCPECINSDIHVVGFPYWRKEWCFVDSPCCLLHGGLLSILNCDEHADAHKPWRAFSVQEPSIDIYLDASFLASNRRFRQPNFTARDVYACRVQSFLCSARKKEKVYVPRFGCSINSCHLLQCCTILLCTFLSARTDRHGGGIARNLLSDISDNKYYGK